MRPDSHTTRWRPRTLQALATIALMLAAGTGVADDRADAANAPVRADDRGGAGVAAPATDAVRPDGDARRDGERRHRPRRFHGHHGEFGPPVVPAGVTVPTWNELTPAQQQKLAHLRENWDRLPASRRVHALERLERHARWQALTPEQRERLRDGARNFRDLPPELREKMRASLQATRALPEEERRRLFDRWHQLSPEQRRAWLEAGGPGLAPEP
jgi:hypothetical protein